MTQVIPVGSRPSDGSSLKQRGTWLTIKTRLPHPSARVCLTLNFRDNEFQPQTPTVSLPRTRKANCSATLHVSEGGEEFGRFLALDYLTQEIKNQLFS